MKIGIITWLWHENFGTALQAVALQKYLRDRGYDVEMINFRLPDGMSSSKKIKSLQYYLDRLVYHIDRKTHKRDYFMRSKKFRDFIADNCVLTKEVYNKQEYIELCNKYDLLIFGSDQIWNPNWYHPFYFAGYDEITTARCSYAASFGVSNVHDSDIAKNIARDLARFKQITVREEEGVKIVKKISHKSASAVIDPTLLLDNNEWGNLAKKNSKRIAGKKYILCYFLNDNKNHWAAAKKYAKDNGLELVVLPNGGKSAIQSRSIMRDCGPEDFLNLIHGAEYIITDSYHASIFSLIFNKQFCVFDRYDENDQKSQNSRIKTLIKAAGDSFKSMHFGTDTIYTERKDYALINNALAKSATRSRNKLRRILK